MARIFAGPGVADTACPACGGVIKSGTPAEQCDHCGAAYHVLCWQSTGCMTEGCQNAKADGAASAPVQAPVSAQTQQAPQSPAGVPLGSAPMGGGLAAGATAPPPPRAPQSAYQSPLDQNTSGQGSTAIVPAEVKGWSWGAFFLNWIWSIGNQTWIGLLALLPYVGLVMTIVLGVKGNEWAWQNRRWNDVDHFKRTQRVWTMWGVGLFIFWLCIAVLAAILFPVFAKARFAARGY